MLQIEIDMAMRVDVPQPPSGPVAARLPRQRTSELSGTGQGYDTADALEEPVGLE